MDWNHIEGNWDKLKGKVKEKWGKFTDEDIAKMKGSKDEIIGRIKHVYGTAHEDAVKQSEEFRNSLSDTFGKDADKGDDVSKH
jgi:uncharacterized protein YjbJ (UPF0337 family)